MKKYINNVYILYKYKFCMCICVYFVSFFLEAVRGEVRLKICYSLKYKKIHTKSEYIICDITQ